MKKIIVIANDHEKMTEALQSTVDHCWIYKNDNRLSFF